MPEEPEEPEEEEKRGEIVAWSRSLFLEAARDLFNGRREGGREGVKTKRRENVVRSPQEKPKVFPLTTFKVEGVGPHASYHNHMEWRRELGSTFFFMTIGFFPL